jgi:hypothetical protein
MVVFNLSRAIFFSVCSRFCCASFLYKVSVNTAVISLWVMGGKTLAAIVTGSTNIFALAIKLNSKRCCSVEGIV